MYNGGKEEGEKKTHLQWKCREDGQNGFCGQEAIGIPLRIDITLLTTYIPDLERYTERYTYLGTKGTMRAVTAYLPYILR